MKVSARLRSEQQRAAAVEECPPCERGGRDWGPRRDRHSALASVWVP